MQLATVTCPNQALTNCGPYTNVEYSDSEPNNTPENMYIAMHGSVRLLLPLKRICGYNPPQCLVFLSVPPDVIERDPRVGLARIFRTVTMGNFPRIYSTHQLSLCHSTFYLYFYRTRTSGGFPRIYTDLSYYRGISSRICYRTGHAAESRSSRDSSHFQFSVTFPVSQLAHRIKRGRRLPRD